MAAIIIIISKAGHIGAEAFGNLPKFTKLTM